jgi:ABC-type nickel/cobalt efflux system permease component RcnA
MGDMAYQPVGYPPRQRRGLAVAALVLGIVAILTLPLCGLGAIVGVAGIIVGIVAITRHTGRGMAVTGVVLSAISLIIAIGLAAWFFTRVAPCADKARYPTRVDRDHCLQRRVPFFKPSSAP